MKRFHFLKKAALTSVIIFNCVTLNAARNSDQYYSRDIDHSFVNFSAFTYSFGSGPHTSTVSSGNEIAPGSAASTSSFVSSDSTTTSVTTTVQETSLSVSNDDHVIYGQEAMGYNPNRNPISDPEIQQEINNMSPPQADQPTDDQNMDAVWDAIIADLAPTDKQA